MQAILLVTVFSCLLGAANAATVELGASCTVASDCADANADCSDTTSKCVCRAGFTSVNGVCIINGSTGTACLTETPSCVGPTLVCDSNICKKKAGDACVSTTNCVSHSTCFMTCGCDSGYTATSTGLCNGVAPQSVSSWLLIGTIITCLVTLCLP